MKGRLLLAFVFGVGLLLTATIVVAGAQTPPDPTFPLDRGGESAASGAEVQATEDFSPTWTGGGPIGGATVAIAVDPLDSDVVFAGMYGAGLRRSTDGGATWDDTPIDPAHGLDPGQSQGYLQDVRTAPGVVYALNSWMLHTSLDGGAVWTHQDTPSDGEFRRLAVHPTVTTTLFLVGSSVYSSSDAGSHWVSATVGLPSGGYFPSMTIDSTDPLSVYVSEYGGGTIYKSVDGGASWSNSSTGLPTGSAFVREIAINPLTPTLVYAATDGEGVYRSADGGVTWAEWGKADLGCPYVRKVLVDPTDQRTVFAGTDGDAVYKRAEGEAHWTYVGPSYSTGQRRAHALTLPANAPDTVYVGIYGDGVYRSTDGGDTWQARTTGFNAVTPTFVRPHPLDSYVAYATANGGLYRTANGGQSWARINDTGTILYQDTLGLDISTAGTTYVGMYKGSIITTTDGTHWHEANSGLPADTVRYIAANPVTPATVYAVLCCNTDENTRGVYRSTNGGGSWVRSSTGITDTEVRVVAVDPSDPQIVYAGTYNGNVFRSTDGGDSWALSNTGIVLLGGEPRIAGLLPDSQSHGTVFMAQSSAGYVGQGGVYKSTDYGLNWTQVYASTGNEPCSLAFDPTDHDVLMVNVWNDVMLRSEDGGDTWASYDPGFFGSRYMWDIASVRTQVGWRLYAGTETHGIWQANIGSMATYLPCVIK